MIRRCQLIALLFFFPGQVWSQELLEKHSKATAPILQDVLAIYNEAVNWAPPANWREEIPSFLTQDHDLIKQLFPRLILPRIEEPT